MKRQALATLAATRPAIARLDRSRAAAALAADIGEAWAGVETALRVLLGHSPAGGQELIHEARQRALLTFEQANALAAFHAARERCASAAYQATDRDIDAAREGFLRLEASLEQPEGSVHPEQMGEAMSTKGLRLSPLGMPRPVNLPPERQPWWFVVVWVLLVALLAVGVWLVFGRTRDAPVSRGVEYWESGNRALALNEFQEAVRVDPRNATAHVYLARMAREDGDLTLAREHVTLAVQAEPGNALALREMGSALLAAGNYELARRFYVRAVQASPDDRAAQGWLGCTLVKLGRPDEGIRWLDRAGPGGWSACAGRSADATTSAAAPRP